VSFPRVGVIGAGQLARMMAVPANDLGIPFTVFAGAANDGACAVADFVIGDYTKAADVLAFAKTVDILTFEHELVPSSVIREIEKAGIKVYPRADSFQFSQNKLLMRKKMLELGLPNPQWQEYTSGASEIAFPLIAKLPTGGYDGRGVFVIQNQLELDELAKKVGSTLLLEEALNFDYEAAVMVARSPHGQAATWAPVLTVQKDGICTQTVTPIPNIAPDLATDMQEIALKIAEGIGLIGVMAVELFVIGNHCIINELALRPHNSGHWSIEGSVTSQFEQHLRAILDLPLGSTATTAPYTVMGNVLGGDKTDMFRPYLHLMARTPALKFHQYGKEVRPGRKIGHLTLTGENLLELQDEVTHAVAYMTGEIDE
jgi:5-(carboxyamino)imidazole ribonucleotide synthase